MAQDNFGELTERLRETMDLWMWENPGADFLGVSLEVGAFLSFMMKLRMTSSQRQIFLDEIGKATRMNEFIGAQ